MGLLENETVAALPTTLGELLIVHQNSNINLAHTSNTSETVSYAPAPTLNTWTHYAFVRESGNVRAYKDGVKHTDTSYTYDFSNTFPVLIGANGNATYTWHGNLQDFRLYKGYAKYTENFTPPKLADYFQYLTFSAPLNTVNSDISITHVNTYELSAGIGTTATTLSNTAVSVSSNATNSAGIATYLHNVNAGIGSTVITSSLYVNAGTATTVGIDTYKFGTSSVRFTGVSNSRLTGSSTGFGTTDFTISFFFHAQGAGQNNYNAPYDQRPAGTNGVYPMIYSLSNGPMRYFVSSGNRIIGTTNMTTASGWHHICIQRNSGITRLFVDGTQEGSNYTDSNNYIDSTIALGDLALSNSYNMNANLDDLVVWNGVANYTIGFTIGVGNTIQVPTSQYDINTDPNKEYVVISSTFEDTPVGTTDISYIATKERGIALFDGTTSAITGTASTAFYFGTDDYTIECWYYKNTTDTAGSEYLFDGRVDNNTHFRPSILSIQASGGPIAFYLNGGSRIYGQNIGGANFGTNDALGITTDPRYDLQGRSNLNKWNHVALSRKDGITRLYQNGKIQGVYDDANSYDGPGMRIGNYWNGGFALNGYIQDFQVYKGYAKYYPTGESQWNETLITNATGVRELNYASYVKGIASQKVDNQNVYVIAAGNDVGIATDAIFTNVGVADTVNVDYLVNNNVVGVATTSAFGTGSAYFGGTTNYGALRYSGPLNYGTKDFSFEAWVYYDSVSGTQFLYDGRYTNNNAHQWALYQANGTLYYYVYNGNRITGTSALTAGQWHHIAVARTNNVTKLFVDGTQVGSNYADNNNFTDIPNSGSNAAIGSQNTIASPLNGYMNGLRIYSGYNGGYDSNFTPPTGPLTTTGDANISKLRVLANFNTIGDVGIETSSIPYIPYQYYGKKSIISSGITTSTFRLQQPTNTAIVGYSKVGIGTTSKFGSGSAYFDGNNYLRYSDPRNSSYVFGTGDFSIEFWVNPSTLSGTQVLYDGRPGTAGPYPYIYTSETTLRYNANSGNRIEGTLTTDSWQHVLIQRESGSTKMFIDGVEQGTYADTTFYRENGAGPNYRYIGCDYNRSNRFVGYIEDFRIYNGISHYTLEKSAKENDFTVCNGNTQISTASSAYGGSSVYFDG